MSNTFFYSDPHFYHSNIIKYCNRPFVDMIEMNNALINNFNAVVKPEDTVWWFGDVSFANEESTEKIFKRMNGIWHLIYGNHDKVIRKSEKLQSYFKSIQEYKEIDVNHNGRGYHLVMCHFPLLTWNRAHHGSIMLHGHCHGNINHLNKDTRRLDVGVDVHNYYPASIAQVIKIMDDRQYQIVDHHGKREM